MSSRYMTTSYTRKPKFHLRHSLIKKEQCCNSVAPKFIGVRGTSVCVLCEIRRKFHYCAIIRGDRGSTVVKVLCYKSEGRWFDPSLCHWIFH